MSRLPLLDSSPLKAVLVVISAVLIAGPLAAQVGNNETVLNPNRATDDDLAGLPHMTTELMAEIENHRPFLRMADFDAVVGKHVEGEQRGALYATLFVPINLNTASEDEILMVPSVGKRMAHEFDEYRPYVAMSQFRREIGKYVDEAQVAAYEQYVFVPISLNTASDEDILTIPGIGKRMLHEFKEYRPYANIEQFRREIGKYVDDGEVARLERYVFVE